ncbi:uncharacterized protein LOC121980428 [Zingiber officinale]|uniref:SWIM-type domain-containing protein n=1 Tax=Zingiber officinale TaxID=94328 RepID=A0A8J5GI89_ZINOF|nr:uncharacterized protein LOC121980428 [Zingiber officinale]XP_042388395.1 uncharacterized protein LOC121980428 [Zingiber officinale]KAG6506536.1 hypothetical protein ZIOFF_031860 [Zingiber officinale]
MASEKILTVCQYGGHFVRNNDGSMSYSGGDAHAIDIDSKMSLEDLKSEIASMFSFSDEPFSIKYFLPRNKRTPITISNDKDLMRMISYHANSDTTDIYVTKISESRMIRSDVTDSGTFTNADITQLANFNEAEQIKVCSDWDNLITGVGQVFSTSNNFRDALHKYAIAHSFIYKLVKNDQFRVTAECTVEDCPWRIHASRSSAKQKFMIKKINPSHTCGKELTRESHKLDSQRWVASVIKDKLREIPNYKPKDIANDLEQEYGLSLNYSQVWCGKSIAKKDLYNPFEEAFNQLSWFCDRIIETNPGSVATLHKSNDLRFRFFVAFHASLYGFEHGCRPFLFLDAFSLKENRHLKFLAATAVDGENDIYPVAFSVVDTENNETWHWFLEQLKSSFTQARAITFISSSQNGMEEELSKVFEDGFHCYSEQYLIENFQNEMKSSWTQEVKDKMIHHLKSAIYANTVNEFNECIENIRSESKEIAEWVLGTKPETWSDAFFKGLRYGQYSSVAVEKYNDWLSVGSEPSVLQIVDTMRCSLMELMYSRRVSCNTWTEALVPSANQKVQEDMIRAHSFALVRPIGTVFEVIDESTNVVNTETNECTCRRWQVSGLPCIHALAVIEHTNGCIYAYCSKYFSSECYRIAYSLSINPIPDVGMPVCTNPFQFSSACSLRARRPAGRPKEKPDEPRIAIKRPLRCSKCQAVGHNKRTCKTEAHSE